MLAGCEACGSRQAGPLRAQGEALMVIHPDLLEILACPKCKGEIRLAPAQDGLICDRCRLVYEIRDDIPIMLIEEAKPFIET